MYVSNLSSPARVATFSSLAPARFPYWIFNPVNSASAHYRAASFYQFISCNRCFWPSPRSVSANPGYVYATLVSKYDRFLSYISLWSLANASESVPNIFIALDDGFSAFEASDFFSELKLRNLTFITRSQVYSWLSNNNFPSLAWFCRAHVFGFKLGFNLMLSSARKVLYADSDVLWFAPLASDFIHEIDVKYVAASLDAGDMPYDPILMSFLREYLSLSDSGGINGCAGVALFAQSVDFALMIERLLRQIHYEIPVSRLTEQTIVSAFALKERSMLPASFMTMDSETTAFSPSASTRNCVGRHYPANLRTQFWVDSFFLRLFCRRK